ncbi:CheR family methyltransferase [Vreelandella sp.]|uniref:CheR family methyltransferase n=1 Tax=Vreelandella sp. TaxID=3137778 RepID=UPI003BA9EFFF
MSSLAPFKQWVHQRCGLHLEGLAEARLIRAVDTLKTELGTQDSDVLLAHLTQDNTLFDRFISQLTVNETYFFREPEAIHWLVETHLPRRLADKGGPLRLLSAGCSSGEEPYSVAMALLERYGDRARTLFHITGGDVDQQVLNKAQVGLYSGMAFRALHPSLKARFFTPKGRSFQLVDALRQWVSFRSLNLLAPCESPIGGPFDVILFRNVSIYFDKATRRQIQRQLKQLLAPKGILLCGVTETLGNDLGVLSLVDDQGIFYFQADSTALPAMTETLTEHRAQALTGPDEPLHAMPLPGAQTQVPPPPPRSDPTALLQQALEQLNQNRFNETQALLAPLLADDPWNVDALLLAGLVARWQQQPQQAFDCFKRALYVAPECWPAHFYQAELLRQGELPDNPTQRQRGYAAVIRLLDASPTSSGGLKAIPPPLPPGDACFLAKRYAAEQTATQGVG